jgi:hypothetical protein
MISTVTSTPIFANWVLMIVAMVGSAAWFGRLRQCQAGDRDNEHQSDP